MIMLRYRIHTFVFLCIFVPAQFQLVNNRRRDTDFIGPQTRAEIDNMKLNFKMADDKNANIRPKITSSISKNRSNITSGIRITSRPINTRPSTTTRRPDVTTRAKTNLNRILAASSNQITQQRISSKSTRPGKMQSTPRPTTNNNIRPATMLDVHTMATSQNMFPTTTVSPRIFKSRIGTIKTMSPTVGLQTTPRQSANPQNTDIGRDEQTTTTTLDWRTMKRTKAVNRQNHVTTAPVE
jgi:hypothetical protein